MSFLSAADVADLATVNRQGFVTKLTVFPDHRIDLVLARWSDAQQNWIALPPQPVYVEFADRQERQIRSETGELTTIDGWLTGYAPFDVERGDLFAMGPATDEERAEIVVVRPARLGTQRAAFRLRLGEL